jgi:hypothetical protein
MNGIISSITTAKRPIKNSSNPPENNIDGDIISTYIHHIPVNISFTR